ncbi:MAG: TlyA family RNA methyltransferase [Bdellovibrionales bacterium]|nr:TlyA family RNA methyltransferase [Bdellovibrionales bacterium]
MTLIRLDILLQQRGAVPSREVAQALILAGSVWSGNQRLEKPGQKVRDDLDLEIRERLPRFVSRAGEKLEAALNTFAISVAGRSCLDVGASTGGFTDCLLQRGAARVIALDVGYGQLDYKLRKDPRVVPIERFNARYLTAADLEASDLQAGSIDFVCMDTSFISLTRLVEPVCCSVPKLRDLVVLFKPQFEVGRAFVKKGGLVTDERAIQAKVAEFDAFMLNLGLKLKNGPQKSPVPGKKSGNVELLIHYERQ